MSDADGDVVMADAKKDVQVDEALYSRQLYVFGHEAQKRMAETNVLLVGLRGLGVEIAKNIILAGVKSVGLLDHGLVTISDLSAQFYLDEKSVGKNRAAACFDRLVELNKYVKVHLVKEDIQRAIDSKAFQVVVVTDTPVAEQIALDEACRKHGIKFIAADIRGLFGSVFVDLGPAHVVTDKDGEELKRGLIVAVTQGNPGIVTVHEDRRHGLETGDLVTFEEIEGMVELNNSAPRPIKVISPHSFSIEDTTGFHAYTGSRGYFQQVKQTIKMSFKSLKEANVKPSLVGDVSFTGLQLHCLYNALSTFQGKHGGKLPDPTSPVEAKEVLDLVKAFSLATFEKADVDEKLLIKLARCASAQLSPMAALMGGIVGQEVLKACTGKFTPISEFLYYDASKCLPDAELDMKEYAPLNSRYDAQIAVFGRSLHEQIMNLRYFLVGAGAIGCEMLKNWALMGLACGPRGHIWITDMDTIEKSNLNRQFLFREHDVQQLKSQTAAREGKRMNPDLKITAQSLRVGATSEDTYDDRFWEGLDGVCTALDNVDARLYVDSRCVYYQKPLIDSGTLGTKGNTQVVVPFLTESYGSSRDPPEESIPICTLKNFPNKIEHTIQWARDLFEGYFKQAPEEVNTYLTTADYFEEIAKSPNTQLSNLQTILDSLVTSRPRTFDDCIRWARFKFQEEFSNKIRQLLAVFPVDSKDSAGTPFWSGPKRPPEPIAFDSKDPLHLDFVIAAANLRAFNYGLEGTTDPAVVRRVLDGTVVPVFVPSAGMKIAKNDEEAKAMAGQIEDDHDRKVAEVSAALPTPPSLGAFRMRASEFEKDDDKNFHMDFITACSNLRARNYKIKEESKHQTKFIAGKIIPAIATTTALVTGLVCLEIYKLIQRKPLEAFQNTYVNLAIPLISASEPMPPARKEAKLLDRGEWKWSLWDRIDIDIGDVTLKDFLDYFRERFGLEATMISYGSSMLYYQFGAGKKNVKERLKLPMSRVVEKVAKVNLTKERYLVLEIVAANPDTSEDVDIPYIRLKIKP